jgi:4-amino-4-deoxy-L-arabinose transferase-like glycosyltransferase
MKCDFSIANYAGIQYNAPPYGLAILFPGRIIMDIDTVRDFIQKNPAGAAAAAAGFILIAGFLLKKLRVLAVILIVLASFIIYVLLYSGTFKPSRLDDIKKKTRDRVMENIMRK